MIIGHQNQIEVISNLLKKNNFPNSLILSGPKGIGKSLIANNICLAHQKIIPIINLNKIYKNLDLNSNVYVIKKIYLEEKKRYKQKVYRDDINYIYDFFSTKNDYGTKKICLIDSIDDLADDAKNSLLKIIEEPNADNHFIIISHDINKVIPTIKSRSHHIKFNNFFKLDYMDLLDEINDIPKIDPTYIYSLTKGSLALTIEYINNSFREIDDHLTSIIRDTNLIKHNTAYHYINFLKNKGSENELIISFFNFFILKICDVIKSSKNKNDSIYLLSMHKYLNSLKTKFVTFNLSYEHLLIHYFNTLKNGK